MKNNYIKSPLNYVGGKYKLLPQIVPLFPDNIDTFVDLFGGGFNVGINVKANRIIYNDINYYIANILEGIAEIDIDKLILIVENIIKEYDLSNKEGFLKLRQDYNNGKDDWVTLFVLSCYSFNWQIRFNNKHQYNSSWGKDRSSFTDRQKNSLIAYKNITKQNNIVFLKQPFNKFNFQHLDQSDFVYADPPYLSSTASYNDGKRGFDGWSNYDEQSLLSILDDLNDKNIKFALSNNLKYENPFLDKWKDKYNVHYLNGDYSNCNYHKKDRSKDVEVLITNY